MEVGGRCVGFVAIVANCGQLWPIVAIVAIVAETVANCGQLWPIWRGPKGFRAVFSVFVKGDQF